MATELAINSETEALRLLANFQRLRRTIGIKTVAIVYAPARGRWPARFAVMPTHQIDRMAYLEKDPWRLVGVYRDPVSSRRLAEDLTAYALELASDH